MAKRPQAGGGKTTTADSTTDPAEELTYEQAVEELETIIERIESGEIGLEDSIRQYERGAVLLKRCREILGRAEQRIERLDAESLADAGAGPDAGDGEDDA